MPNDFGIILESEAQCGWYAALSTLTNYNLVECQRLMPGELEVWPE